MSRKLTLTIFAARTPLGQELAQKTETLAQGKCFEVITKNNATPWEFFKACENSDAVVLDATIEADPETHNYSFVSPFNLEHVLIVARSYVPLNFVGIIEGGTAKYSDPVTPSGQKSNESILSWLNEELQKICEHPRKASTLQRFMPSLIKMILAQGQARNHKRERLKKEKRVFISYRSKHHSRVVDFVNRLQQGNYGEKYKGAFLFYLDPGELVFENELLSPLRRWQLLSMIQDYIIAAEEVWIFKTKDYLNSWWTRGEVLSTIYFAGEDKLQQKLKVFDPDTGTMDVIKTEQLPKLSSAHSKRMARYQANSHPDMMAPEVLDRNRLVEPLSDISAVRKLFMLDDPVFSPEFWEYYLVPCHSRQCSQLEVSSTSKTHQFYQELPGIDVDDFLKLSRQTDLFVTVPQLQKAARGLEPLICPRCQNEIVVIEEKPRFLWVPQPHIARQGGNWGRLDELPVFRSGSKS